MNKKKVQSLILAGTITVNIACPRVTVTAQELPIQSDKVTIEETIVEEEPQEEMNQENIENDPEEKESIEMKPDGVKPDADSGIENETTTSPETNPDMDNNIEAPPVEEVPPVQEEKNTFVEIHSESQLIDEINKGSNIKLMIDITLTQQLNINKDSITIDGNSKTIKATGLIVDPIIVRGDDVSITNVTIEDYDKIGIVGITANGLSLSDINLNGKQGVSAAGLDISESTDVKIHNITSSNHRQAGIRLKKGSSVTISGKMSHTDDVKQLVLVGDTNSITDNGDDRYASIGKDASGNEVFKIKEVIKVYNESDLENALKKSDVTINIEDNITLTKSMEIWKDANNTVLKGIEIIGNDKFIDFGVNNKITFKTQNMKISNLVFKNYLNTAVCFYSAKGIELDNITLQGNDVMLPNAERSKIGMDITNSTATLNNIKSENHLYRAIQVKRNSTVKVNGAKHFNDSIHLQAIEDKEGKPTIISSDYKEIKTIKDANGYDIEDHYTKEVISIKTAQDLVDNSKNSGTVLELAGTIEFDKDDSAALIAQLEKLDSHPFPDRKNEKGSERDLGLNILKNIEIKGNGHTIDLGRVVGLVIKGNDSVMKDIKVTNSVGNGISVYNSENVELVEVIVENNPKVGIVANGSIVNLTDCKTINNGEAGIMATRERILDKEGDNSAYRDSEITIYKTLEQQESHRDMIIRDLEMIYSDHKQDNKIFFTDDKLDAKYQTIEKDEVKMELSAMDKLIFQKWFEDKGISSDTKYGSTDTDIIKVQERINVTAHDKVHDEQGNPILLDNTGTKDNTENFKKLLRYATLNAKELYFPAGTYLINDDIDLTTLNTWAFSNVTIVGDENGLSIIDASSVKDTMPTIKNNLYHNRMGYVVIKDMAFNNVGIDVNGPYKNDIRFSNNVFMNGKYTTEYNNSGIPYKAIMTPYITANNSKYLIEKNVFLRGEEYAGRGISTYASKDTVIKNNFFGNMDALEDAKTMLPETVMNKIALINVTRNVSGRQGNFFTCVNNERGDVNVTIEGNYFNANEVREVDGVPSDVLIAGINAAKDGQRRDHIIYSKGYNGLNIVGNYFKGMENGAAGGVKIRNGENAYIGSNHFKNVPLLTYIYGDLSIEECLLYNTTIYNNVFHETTNMGKEGTGILFYQSFRNGDRIEFSNGQVLESAIGDVRNFVAYKNIFFAGEDSVITISNRSEDVKDQFYMNGNYYWENNGQSVNFNKGNMTIEDSAEDVVLTKVNDGFATHSSANIPLWPSTVDNTQLTDKITETETYLEDVKDKIGDAEGQFSPILADRVKELLEKAKEVLANPNSTQAEINDVIVDIIKAIEKLERDINVGGDMVVDPGTLPPAPNYDVEDDMEVLVPDAPNHDVEDEMGVTPEDPTVGDGTHMDKNEVTPGLNDKDKLGDDNEGSTSDSDNGPNNNGSNNGSNNESGSTGNNNSNNSSTNGTKPTTKPNWIQTLPQTGGKSSIALLGVAALASIAGLVLMKEKKER